MRTQVHWACVAALLGASQPHNEMHRAAQNPVTVTHHPFSRLLPLLLLLCNMLARPTTTRLTAHSLSPDLTSSSSEYTVKSHFSSASKCKWSLPFCLWFMQESNFQIDQILLSVPSRNIQPLFSLNSCVKMYDLTQRSTINPTIPFRSFCLAV